MRDRGKGNDVETYSRFPHRQPRNRRRRKPRVEGLSIGSIMMMDDMSLTTAVVPGIVIQPKAFHIWKGRNRQ